MARPTKINIDLGALKQNFERVRAYAPKSRVISCVKANAYGHGIVEISRVLAGLSDALAVASIDEAQVLRGAGIDSEVLLLEGAFEAREWAQIDELGLWPVIHNEKQFMQLLAIQPAKPLDVWIKVDSGMHRLGFSPKEAANVIERLGESDWQGTPRLMTHFACADELDNEFTNFQMQQFFEVANQFGYEQSLANSAGIIAWPDSRVDWVRPGFMLYGLSPFGQSHPSAKELIPVMSFESKVTALRDVEVGEGVGYNHKWFAERPTRIAIVAAGYGDGYPRNTSNGTPVLIDGQRAKTVGHIAMDMMMVDVTETDGVEVGSHAELWGKNLSVNEVAASSGYSPYELLTRMPLRAVREYKGNQALTS